MAKFIGVVTLHGMGKTKRSYAEKLFAGLRALLMSISETANRGGPFNFFCRYRLLLFSFGLLLLGGNVYAEDIVDFFPAEPSIRIDLNRHRGEVMSMSFIGPNQLVSVGADNDIRVWTRPGADDLWKSVVVPLPHGVGSQGQALSLATRPNGKLVAVSGSWSPDRAFITPIVLLSIDTKDVIHLVDDRSAHISAMAFVATENEEDTILLSEDDGDIYSVSLKSAFFERLAGKTLVRGAARKEVTPAPIYVRAPDNSVASFSVSGRYAFRSNGSSLRIVDTITRGSWSAIPGHHIKGAIPVEDSHFAVLNDAKPEGTRVRIFGNNGLRETELEVKNRIRENRQQPGSTQRTPPLFFVNGYEEFFYESKGKIWFRNSAGREFVVSELLEDEEVSSHCVSASGELALGLSSGRIILITKADQIFETTEITASTSIKKVKLADQDGQITLQLFLDAPTQAPIGVALPIADAAPESSPADRKKQVSRKPNVQEQGLMSQQLHGGLRILDCVEESNSLFISLDVSGVVCLSRRDGNLWTPGLYIYSEGDAQVLHAHTPSATFFSPNGGSHPARIMVPLGLDRKPRSLAPKTVSGADALFSYLASFPRERSFHPAGDLELIAWNALSGQQLSALSTAYQEIEQRQARYTVRTGEPASMRSLLPYESSPYRDLRTTRYQDPLTWLPYARLLKELDQSTNQNRRLMFASLPDRELNAHHFRFTQLGAHAVTIDPEFDNIVFLLNSALATVFSDPRVAPLLSEESGPMRRELKELIRLVARESPRASEFYLKAMRHRLYLEAHAHESNETYVPLLHVLNTEVARFIVAHEYSHAEDEPPTEGFVPTNSAAARQLQSKVLQLRQMWTNELKADQAGHAKALGMAGHPSFWAGAGADLYLGYLSHGESCRRYIARELDGKDNAKELVFESLTLHPRSTAFINSVLYSTAPVDPDNFDYTALQRFASDTHPPASIRESRFGSATMFRRTLIKIVLTELWKENQTDLYAPIRNRNSNPEWLTKERHLLRKRKEYDLDKPE